MKQKIVSQAEQIIRERREKAEREARQNLLSALDNPEFKNAYELFEDERINKAKCEAFNEKYQGNYEKIEKNLQNIIKKLKLSSLTPNYHCPFCHDMGRVNGKYCECLKTEIAHILMHESGFDKLESFDKTNFDIFENKQETKKIYDLMQKWCQPNITKNTVLICGQTGTGKTHLTKCIAERLIERGVITQIMSAFNLGQKFLAIHTASEEQKGELINEILDIETLIIDDLGTEPKYRNVTREYLYLLLNERQLRGLRTIITTNLYPDDIMTQYDERIFSRLMDKTKTILLEMKGKDLRLNKNKA